MASDLSPAAVAARLESLRARYVPMTEAEARARMEPARARRETFDQGVARRLRELRALMDLTEHLHRARGRPRAG